MIFMAENNSVMQEYRGWILEQTSDAYTIEQYNRYGRDCIRISTDYADAYVGFLELQSSIVELEIISHKDNSNQFYLHFEMYDLEHAQELFNEMIQCLLELKDRQKTKVILCCSSALTTSFFVTKLQEAADVLDLKYEFSAVSYNKLFVNGFDADIVLLAPQIRYLYPTVRGILKDCTVISIPTAVFAQYDAEGILRLLAEKGETRRSKARMQAETEIEGPIIIDNALLMIAVICEYDVKKIMYRVYNHGKVIRENQIIKTVYTVRDLEDLIDVAVSTYTIDIICIATPGVIDGGRLTFRESKIYDEEVQERFQKRYDRKVLFCNDANAMAVGFQSMNPKYDSISFYFHPHAARVCGVGSVIDGKLMAGRNSIAGEMQFIVNIIGFSADPHELARTPEGSLELVSKYLTAIISCIDPQAIAISCDMIPDLDILRNRLAVNIRPDFIPDLIKADDVSEYMFAGGIELVRREVLKI